MTASFGLIAEAPPGTVAVWGARAITDPGFLSRHKWMYNLGFVWNRAQITDGTGAELAEDDPARVVLVEHLEGAIYAIKGAYQEARRFDLLDPRRRNRVRLFDAGPGGLVVVADCNASHGYLYLGAWIRDAAKPGAVCDLFELVPGAWGSPVAKRATAGR